MNAVSLNLFGNPNVNSAPKQAPHVETSGSVAYSAPAPASAPASCSFSAIA